MDLDRHAAGVINDFLTENYADFLIFAEERDLSEAEVDQTLEDLNRHAGRV